MDIVIPIMIMMLCYKARMRITTSFDDPFSKMQTTSINGFFAVLVFIRHFYQYIEARNHDHILKAVNSYSNQFIVVPFLFFSGYAIMLKITEDRAYINRIPRKSFFLWLHFVLGIAFFLALNLIMGRTFSLQNIFLSLFGLYSIGNSTWYVVAIVCLWISTYISLKVFKEDRYAIVSIAVFMVLYSVIFHQIKTEIWYNTIIAYFLGILFFKCMHRTGKIIREEVLCSWLLFILSIAVVIAGALRSNLYLFEVRVACFVLFLVFICHKIQVGNKALTFLGTYIFEIYLLERLPMIALQNKIKSNILYFIVCFAITIVLALLFRKLTACVDDQVRKAYYRIRAYCDGKRSF